MLLYVTFYFPILLLLPSRETANERASERAAFIVNNCNKPRSLCARSSAWPRPRPRESGESLVGQRDSVGMGSARTGSTAAWRRVTRLGQLQFKPEKKKRRTWITRNPGLQCWHSERATVCQHNTQGNALGALCTITINYDHILPTITIDHLTSYDTIWTVYLISEAKKNESSPVEIRERREAWKMVALLGKAVLLPSLPLDAPAMPAKGPYLCLCPWLKSNPTAIGW